MSKHNLINFCINKTIIFIVQTCLLVFLVIISKIKYLFGCLSLFRLHLPPLGLTSSILISMIAYFHSRKKIGGAKLVLWLVHFFSAGCVEIPRLVATVGLRITSPFGSVDSGRNPEQPASVWGGNSSSVLIAFEEPKKKLKSWEEEKVLRSERDPQPDQVSESGGKDGRKAVKDWPFLPSTVCRIVGPLLLRLAGRTSREPFFVVCHRPLVWLRTRPGRKPPRES